MVPLATAAALFTLNFLPQSPPSESRVESDTYFYGDSPPVYPSPNITGTGRWRDAFHKAAALVARMTVEEKLNVTTGYPAGHGCSGSIAPVHRLGFPGLCVSDAGQGLRQAEFVNAWPSGISAAASWNRNLSHARGYGMAGEFRRKGVNVLLGPVVETIGRTATNGRNWEGLGPDPYLSGALVYQTITGIQDNGVTACAKHFIGDEQETHRNPEGDVSSVSANIDDKTMHELYLWPFQDAVHAGSGSIMCSYNRVNNSFACQNSKTLNGLLKTELGFQGYVMTDWGALHAGYHAPLAGLDMAMPSGAHLWGPGGQTLGEAIRNASLPTARLDDMATRVLAAWYQAGQDKDFPTPGVGVPKDLSHPHMSIDGREASSKPILYQGALEAHVLVKNIREALPLKKPKMLSIYGYSAKSPDWNNIDNWVVGGEPYAGGDLGTSIQGIASNGTMYSGGGSGATSQSLLASPMNELTNQCWEDDTQMFWDFTRSHPTVNTASDACLVFINAWASEGYDRPSLSDQYSDALVRNVAGQCAKTIVVIHNAGIRLVDDWIDLENVTAVIYAHLPGQASGKALVSLLYGRENFSGRLPYTVAKRVSDYGDMARPCLPKGQFELFPQCDFAEGLLVDYRRFDYYDMEPLFEFGFGMSYTSFDYAGLSVDDSRAKRISACPTGPIRQGGQTDLWEGLVTVKATVQNSGSRAGNETAQLYLATPGAGSDGVPVKQLRGFEKVSLQPGQGTQVSFTLTRRDLSQWDVVAQKWRLSTGTYTVLVGSSSRRLPVTGSFTLATV